MVLENSPDSHKPVEIPAIYGTQWPFEKWLKHTERSNPERQRPLTGR